MYFFLYIVFIGYNISLSACVALCVDFFVVLFCIICVFVFYSVVVPLSSGKYPYAIGDK
jgi:hypothetical protein